MASKRKSLPAWYLLAKALVVLVGSILTLLFTLGYGIAYGLTALICCMVVLISNSVDKRVADRWGASSGRAPREKSDCSSACRNSRAPKRLCRCPCGGKTHGKDRGMGKLLRAEGRARANRPPSHPRPRERGKRVERDGQPVRPPIKPKPKAATSRKPPAPEPAAHRATTGTISDADRRAQRERNRAAIEEMRRDGQEGRERRRAWASGSEQERWNLLGKAARENGDNGPAKRAVRYRGKHGETTALATQAQVNELRARGRFIGFAD